MPLPKNWREQLNQQLTREREEEPSFRRFSDWIKAHQPKPSNAEDHLGLPDFLKDGSFWESFESKKQSEHKKAPLDIGNFNTSFEESEDPEESPWWEAQNHPELKAIGQQADKSISENQDVISETLAQLLARQGKKNKAIKMYEALSLKFPEKSRYFAERIKQLQ